MKKLAILTISLLLGAKSLLAFPIDQTTLEYETNPGTNRVSYQETEPGRGMFTLTLIATEAFGGHTNQLRGQYIVEQKEGWTFIHHKLETGQSFTVLVKDGYTANENVTLPGAPVISGTGNVKDGKGNTALEGETPFRFVFRKQKTSASPTNTADTSLKVNPPAPTKAPEKPKSYNWE